MFACLYIFVCFRTNHTKDHIVERTALPDQLIREVSGQVAFEEQQPRVCTLPLALQTHRLTSFINEGM